MMAMRFYFLLMFDFVYLTEVLTMQDKNVGVHTIGVNSCLVVQQKYIPYTNNINFHSSRFILCSN